MVKGKGFTRHSDIDFVVRGLQENLFFRAFAFLLKNSRFDIDLKPGKNWMKKARKQWKEKVNPFVNEALRGTLAEVEKEC